MLHALELENFKAFGERARIPFAPITLIFGENSAGKSTILQALYLLKQTRESRETGAPLLPRAENGIVDLGSFWEMIFNHDLEQTLSIRIETKVDGTRRSPLPFRKDKIGIELSFKRSSDEKVVFLDQIKIYYGESSKCIAEFQLSDKTIEPQEFLMIDFFRDSSGFLPSKLSAVECIQLTKEPDYWEPEFKWCKRYNKLILQQLEERLENLEHSNEESRGNRNRHKERLATIKNGIELLRSDFDLDTYISQRYSDEMNTVLVLQGFLPSRIMSDRRNSWISELRPSGALRSNRFDVALLAEAAGQGLERALEALFPMGPFRKPPERWYIFRGTSPQDVGYRGDLLPDLLFRNPGLVEKANKWLEDLDMGYKLEEVKPVGPDSDDLFTLRLMDTRRNEPVNVALSDVGYGISQLLPFVVQSLVSEKQVISIEQPEVHVHPKLQADLGDLLAEAIREPRQNQFIIETHSEHLILRLQRLVHEKCIKPEDVSVVYVSRGPNGAKSQRLHLDEEGDFIDEWPNGFFPERLRELR